MIQKINKSALRKLQKANDETLLTAYVPLEKGMKGHKFNTSQLHNLKSELKKSVSSKQQVQISSEIESILEKIDRENESPGIAIFYDGLNVSTFFLPFSPKKTIKISTTYDLGQIQDYYKKNRPYYALAISKKGSRLYEGDMESLKFVPVAGLDQDIQTMLNIDELDTHNLQNHPEGSGGNKSVGFHGHGGFKDVKKSLFDDYLRAVDKKVISSIKDKSTPLVLVSVDYEQSAFKNISKYPSIFTRGVSTNPVGLSLAQLHKKTFPLLVQPN